MGRPLRIGIDFDNTLISYDEIFLSAARERKLLAPAFSGNKQAVRDAIRLLPDGEIAWQRLQGHVYGKGIATAAIFDGVGAFLNRCREGGDEVFIVSHKTEFGHYDPDRISLREAALGWMEAQGFFASDVYAIKRDQVFFEGTRREKLARIGALGCTHYIDDLVEVLTDPAFPTGVERVLFGRPDGELTTNVRVCASWREITAALFARPPR